MSLSHEPICAGSCTVSVFRLWKDRSVGSRLLLLGAVAAAAVLTVLVLLRVPAVQRRVLQWAVGGGKAWRLEAARVSIGPAEGEVRGVRFGMPGLTAHSEAGVVVRIDPFGWMWGPRELRVLEARVEGVQIAVTPSQLGGTSEPFDGVLTSLQSPLPWSVAQARIEITADVVENDGALGRGRLTLEGGGLTRDAAGRFNYTLNLDSPAVPGWPAAGVRTTGVADVRQRADHGVGRIDVRGSLVLPPIRGVTLPAGTLEASAEATATGERYAGRWELEPKTRLEWKADYHRGEGRVSGRMTGTAVARVLAGFFPGTELPEGEAAVTVDFSFVTATGAATAVVEATLAGSEWGRLGPAWAALGAWSGRLQARVERASATEPWRCVTSRIILGTETQADLVVVEGQGLDAATVRVRGFPLARLAPWLQQQGLAAPEGRFDGAWQVTRAGAAQVTVTSLEPARLGPVRIDQPALATLPSLTLELDLAATVEETLARWSAVTVRARPATSAPAAAIELTSRGRWRWAGGGTVEEATVRWPSPAAPGGGAAGLQARLLGTLELDPEGLPLCRPGQVLAELQARAWSFSELETWIPDLGLRGVWAAGTTVVTAGDATGQFQVRTPEPWRFTEVASVQGGAAPSWTGSVQVAPEVELTATSGVGRLSGLHLRDATGRQVVGLAQGAWNSASDSYEAQLDLTATGPRGTLMPPAWGDMTVDLSLKGGSAAKSVQQIERIRVVAKSPTGERLRLEGDLPLFIAQRPSGEWVFNSVAPWKVSLAPMPVSDLADLLPAGWVARGQLGLSEFLLSAEPNSWKIRPLRAVSCTGLSLMQDGVEVVRDLTASFFPAADVDWHHTLHPRFQLAWEAALQATEVRLHSAQGEVLQLEGSMHVVGDDDDALLRRVDGVARGNLAEARVVVPALGRHLPSAGRFTARIEGGLSAHEQLQVWLRLEDVPELGGARTLAPLEISAKGNVDGVKRAAEFSVDLQMGDGDNVSDLGFAVRLGLEDQTLRVTSALRGKRWDLNETLAMSRAWRPVENIAAATAAAAAIAAPTAAPARRPLGAAFWGALRGTFDLDVKQVRLSPYQMDDIRGRIELDERRLTLSGLGGTMFSGTLDGSLGVDYTPGATEGDHRLSGELRIRQFETARVVQTLFPQELGSLDARVDLQSVVRGRGFQLWDLLEYAEVDFGVQGRGTVRLTNPDVRTASTLLVMGGLVTLSPELRALGRLLRKFAEMPVDRLTIEGGRDAAGAIRLSKVWFDSPQARLLGTGTVPAATSPLVARPLELHFNLSARDEVGLILGRMRLLEPAVDGDGFRRLNRSIEVGGQVGRPDAGALYELLARAVDGSRGTWGFIMRKVQREVERQQALATKPKASGR
jgi:hypothetical protein